MKKLLSITLILFFISSMSLGLSKGWKQKGGIYYYVLYDLSKGSNEAVAFEFPSDERNFSAIIVGKGSGNFDVDLGLFDINDELKASDTSPQDIAAASYTFSSDDSELQIKVSCTSGKGIAVIYAGNTADLLRVLTINYLKQ